MLPLLILAAVGIGFVLLQQGGKAKEIAPPGGRLITGGDAKVAALNWARDKYQGTDYVVTGVGDDGEAFAYYEGKPPGLPDAAWGGRSGAYYYVQIDLITQFEEEDYEVFESPVVAMIELEEGRVVAWMWGRLYETTGLSSSGAGGGGDKYVN